MKIHQRHHRPGWFSSLRHLWWLSLLWLLVACGGNISNNKFSKGLGVVEGQLLFPDGEPAVNASVYVVGAPNLKAVTNAQGRFSLSKVPAGKRQLIVTHERPLGLLAPIWVVSKATIGLQKEQQTLKPTATVAGTIDARARFGGKGITVKIVGTPFKTLTHNHNGEFRFDRVVQGCHTFSFSAPYFNTVEKKLCIGESRKTVTLKAPVQLLPKRTCQLGNNPCEALNNICHQGFCVPNAGGEVHVSQPESVFPSVQIGESRNVEITPLVNVGPGVLIIKSAVLKGPSKDFTLQSIKYPVKVQSRESFRIQINFQSNSLEEQRTILEIETNDPAKPTVQIVLRAQPQAFQSQCVKVRRFAEPPFPDKEASVGELHFSLFNRCDRRIEIHKVSLGFPSLLRVRLNVKLPLVLKGAHSQNFKLFFAPKVYGRIEGSITLEYHGSTEKLVKVPVSADVKAPRVTLSHNTFDFGSVPVSHARVHWLQIRVKKEEAGDKLQPFRAQLFDDKTGRFKLGAIVNSRTDEEGNTLFYLPIHFTPSSNQTQQAWLALRHTELFGETPYLVRLKGTGATSTSLLTSPTVVMGRLADCKPKYNAGLFVANPGREKLVIRSATLESLTPEDFQVGFQQLPLTIPPRTSLDLSQGIKLGEGFFRATEPKFQAFASLRLVVEQKGVRLPDVVIPLTGSSSIPYQQTFQQAKSNKARLLVYISSRVLENMIRRSQLATMLSEIVKEMKKHRIQLEVRALRQDKSSPRPVLSLSYKTGELTRFLSSLKRTADSRPVGLQWMHRYLMEQKKTIEIPTAVMFVSYYDDASPLPLSYYHPTLHQKAPFGIFAGVPSSSCRSIKEATRFYRSARFYGGVRFNFCSPTTLGMRSWASQFVAFFKGKQNSFLLRASYQKHQLPNLKVTVNGREIPQGDGRSTNWIHRYVKSEGGKPGYHRIEFSPGNVSRLVPSGSKVQVSYYDVCLER